MSNNHTSFFCLVVNVKFHKSETYFFHAIGPSFLLSQRCKSLFYHTISKSVLESTQHLF